MKRIFYILLIAVIACNENKPVETVTLRKKEGDSIDYFSNGKPRTITTYSNGVKNGYNSYFDSSGNLTYKDYHYYDLTVGPLAYYFADGTPKRYFFISLQNETLLHIDYQDWHGIKDKVTYLIRFSSNSIRIDSTENMHVFLYLMQPPKMKFEYTLMKKKREAESGYEEVRKIRDTLPFTQFDLPLLPDDEHYCIQLRVRDSIINKESVIYKEM